MSSISSKHAKTGRTARMLEHAKQLARTGHKVFVIADNIVEARALEIACKEPKLGIKFTLARSVNLNWETMTVPGIDRVTQPYAVLVDHHAIEDKFAPLLTMLHAYDVPEPAVPAPVLVAVERMANMPEYDQDDVHRLRHQAKALLEMLKPTCPCSDGGEHEEIMREVTGQ